MIVTVTPNPSLDRTLQVDELVVGAVNRATATRTDAGGKGVNVARALAPHGLPVCAVVPLGGASGRRLAELLEAADVDVLGVDATHPTRSNVTLVDADGRVTKVNEPGPPLDAAELDALHAVVVGVVRGADVPVWVATCGSLPAGAPVDLHARLVTAAHAAGARVAVDSSGGAFAAAVQAGPDLVKPNVHELADLVGHPLPDRAAVLAACRDLVAGGVGAVLCSLGADGAVLVDADGAHHARAHAPVVRSDVGAGDATLAGFLAAAHDGLAGPEALRRAVAWGTAAVGLAGTAMPGPDDVDLAAVDLVDLSDAAAPGRA